MARVVLSLGSNCSSAFVRNGLDWLKENFTLLRSSTLYETPPAKGSGSNYINAVAEVKSDNSFEEINSMLKEYEIKIGRDDQCRKINCVPIDIDIVLWDEEIVRQWDFKQKFFRIGYNMIKDS
ncbi:MAG: hypothetical protein HDS12_04170 [Bacteroides sp.]|nr:hypothetical protein [Bacteroides sp.]MBD5349142.1 hypothetical protein [Bacteroides sp.]